jgi:hypothetical protein
MSQQKLSANQIIQLRQGLELRMAELQKRIDDCHHINLPGTANLFQMDLNEATAMQNILNSCYTVTLE